MNAPAPSGDPHRAAREAAAADWLIAHDRGLAPAEQAEFDRWLAADPRHAEAWAEAQQAWARLDRLPELTPLATAERVTPAWRRGLALAAGVAAAVALTAFFWPRFAVEPARPVARMVFVAPQQLTLSDGTLVDLNADSEVREAYTPGERRVRLVRGEAHFAVVKDTARPFIVEASGAAVQAVGTAFSVRLADTAVEVLVTHGRVQVEPPRAPASLSSVAAPVEASAPQLVAGQRAVVSLGPASRRLEISALSPTEIARALAWQGMRLQFQDMPLDQVAAEFNRRNRTQLAVEPSAAGTLVAGSFRADNVEVFVRFLEEGFGVVAELRADGTIALRKAP